MPRCSRQSTNRSIKGLSKSNFNDLRQIFDETKRSSQNRSSDKGVAKSSAPTAMAALYYDAKPSVTDGDNIFESKPQMAPGIPLTKYEFERAKLKFDRSSAKGGSAAPAVNTKSSRGGASSKRNSADSSLLEKKSYNEAVQMVEENKKRNVHKVDGGGHYMKTSLNLDDLKVSDDEVSRAWI